MSNYGVFESAFTDDHDERTAQADREALLRSAIFDAREQFGSFLGSAKDKSDFKDRIALVKNDMMKVVANSLMPVPGVMRKVEGALKPDFDARVKVAAPGPETTYAEAMAHPTYREATDRSLMEMAAQNSSVDLKVVRGIVRGSHAMHPFEETYNLQFGGNVDPNRAHINWNPGNIRQMPHTYYHPVGWYVHVYPEGKILAEGVSSVHEAIQILESSDSFAGEQMSLFSKREKSKLASVNQARDQALMQFIANNSSISGLEVKLWYAGNPPEYALTRKNPNVSIFWAERGGNIKKKGWAVEVGRDWVGQGIGSVHDALRLAEDNVGLLASTKKSAGTRETGDAHADAMSALRDSAQDFVVDALENAVKSGEYVWQYDPEVNNVVGLQSRMGSSNEAFVVVYLGGDSGFDDFEVDEGWLFDLKQANTDEHFSSKIASVDFNWESETDPDGSGEVMHIADFDDGVSAEIHELTGEVYWSVYLDEIVVQKGTASDFQEAEALVASCFDQWGSLKDWAADDRWASKKEAQEDYSGGDFWEGDENPVYADPVELEDWIDEDFTSSTKQASDLSDWEAGDLAFLHQEALDSGDSAKAQEIEQEADRRGINLDDAFSDLDEEW